MISHLEVHIRFLCWQAAARDGYSGADIQLLAVGYGIGGSGWQNCGPCR